MKPIKSIILIFFLIGLSSCHKNKKILHEDYLNLSPNKGLIEKAYYRYSIFNPFHPQDSLYTPIEPSKNFSNRAKTLINEFEFYDLRNFYKYIEHSMDSKYIAYVYENEVPLHRVYIKIYEKGEKKELSPNKEIEDYFKQKKIGYRFLKNEHRNLSIYLLEMKNVKDSAFCVVNSEVDLLTYNAKDTLRSLPTTSFRPFLGIEMEN